MLSFAFYHFFVFYSNNEKKKKKKYQIKMKIIFLRYFQQYAINFVPIEIPEISKHWRALDCNYRALLKEYFSLW